MSRKRTWLSWVFCICAAGAQAHGDAVHERKPRAGQPTETAFGIAGDPLRVQRTIDIDMSDRMRFSPDRIVIREGQTVRLRVRNSGKAMHELVMGTMQELKDHADLMKKHPGMEHDEPYMVHVPPGKTESIVWRFSRAGEFRFGCLVPGHFEAGMMGSILVTKGSSK